MGINSHNKTNVTPKWPLQLFDPSPHLKRESDTVPNERKGQAVVINTILLELRAIQEVLGTLPDWEEGDSYLDLKLGNMIYGDGSDGDHTVSGAETLTEDTYYNNLTVTASGELNTGGFRLFVRNRLMVETGGVIERDGNHASGTTAGAALAPQMLGGSTAGGTPSGGAGGSITNALGGHGGDGGSGGSGGSISTPVTPGFRDLVTATSIKWGNIIFAGGSGGGAGTAATGGAGGSGGGVMMIAAKNVFNFGRISANGGDGGDATASGGGGGGGGGGFLVLVTSKAVEGNALEVNGGSGGLGDSGTPDGDDGGPGTRHVVIL